MKIKSAKSSLSGKILIPASKSHTIRAVALAGIAHGISVLKNPLFSADALSCIEGIKEFGAEVEKNQNLTIKGIDGTIKKTCKKIDVGNSGTSLRILTAIAALADFPIAFDGDNSIRSRLMMPLLSALEMLGATYISANGKCPLTVQGPLKGGYTKVEGISSQFLTALLLAAPLAQKDTVIDVINLNEKPYVEITLDWLRRMKISFVNTGLEHFEIKGNQHYIGFERSIPADFSSAAFPLCAAAITGSEIVIEGLDFNDYQGDKEVFTFLKNMGLRQQHTDKGIVIKGGELTGIDIDMNSTPDALPAMAVAGCFAKGTTRLLNVPQARFKECDRISAITKELKKMGAKIEELEDGVIIHQSTLKGEYVHGYNDHRMVMALSVAGLGAVGDTIVDTSESIDVTYPSFISDMNSIGANIELADI